MPHVLRLLVIGAPVLLALTGCGAGGANSGSESASSHGIDDRKIANALDMHLEDNELIYELDSGGKCRVLEIAQTSADVERILESSENAPDSLATTPGAGAGVEFIGPLGRAPSEECVLAAEADLAQLADEIL